MARHGLHKRAPQIGPDGRTSFSLPSQIGAPSTDSVDGQPLATAASAPALTTITTTQEFIKPLGTGFTTETTVVTSAITDPAQYASLTASQIQSTSSPSRTSATTAAATSSAASSKSSSNLSTLIPAIVVPVVVVLLASLGLFWFFMRRRAQRASKNADFVMAGKGEKLNSRTNSSRSAATGTTSGEKSAPMVVISELKPPQSSRTLDPKYSMEDIGVARPLTPKDGAGPGSPRRPNDRYGAPREQRPYQNFSGPRPRTARDRQAPPSHSQGGRNRSNSSPGKRGPPPSAYDRSRGPPGRPSPEFRGTPSPVPRPGPGPSPIPNSGAFPSARGLPTNPRPAPAPPRPLREPSPTMDHTSRAAPPPSLNAPPPGAFNGASSISQYSPIVKETPKIGSGPMPAPIAAATTTPPKPKSSDGSRAPPPIKTNHLTSNTTSRSMSPTSPSGNFLTEENMRIARLANSSRLGFFNTSATSPSANNTLDKAIGSQQKPSQLTAKSTAAAAGQSPATTSNPSPKLPPPATRSQLIPLDSPREEKKAPFNYFSQNHSRTASMASASSYALTLGQLHTAHVSSDHLSLSSKKKPNPSKLKDANHDDDNDSVVSDLDYYEDIDAKSDVSSLNEFERFEFESRNGSQRGSGSVRGLGFNSPNRFR